MPGWLRGLLIYSVIGFVTLAAIEVILRVADIRYLRDAARPGDDLSFRFDAQLGWAAIPNSAATIVGSRPFHVTHNSLGIRDIEPGPPRQPTILFVGDSFAWGYDAEADQMFSHLLRQRMPRHRIVNSAIPAWGTDQELMFLQRLWNDVQPNVVVLMYCVDNDRLDNTTNVRNDGMYKPYYQRADDGQWQLRGYPLPVWRRMYFNDYWLPRNLWLARLTVSAYLAVRHPRIYVPDPTEYLVGAMRDYVEARGAKFLVGINQREPQLEAFLAAQRIPVALLDDAERFTSHGNHWTSEGHELVATRLQELFSRTGVVSPQDAAR
jgi:hypothetical protein